MSADGLTVVKGEIKTTLFGKPDPNISLLLRPQPAESSTAAVTSGARAVVCGSVRHADLAYRVALRAVRRVCRYRDRFQRHLRLLPHRRHGARVLRSQRLGEELLGGPHHVGPRQLLTRRHPHVTAPGSTAVSQFVTELDSFKSDAAASKLLGAMQVNASDISQTLAQLSGTGARLGGLAYSLVNGTSAGRSFIVYPDTSPPVVDSSGYVTAAPDTLVITPSSWIGTSLLPHTALNVVMQQGQLSSVPTFAQWTAGQSVPGWSLSKNKAVAGTSAFQYDGWAYPSTAVGACS